MLSYEQLSTLIRSALPDAQIDVGEFAPGGDHFAVTVTSAAFAGKSRIAQHQLVYGALREHLDSGVIHALALTTKAPA